MTIQCLRLQIWEFTSHNYSLLYLLVPFPLDPAKGVAVNLIRYTKKAVLIDHREKRRLKGNLRALNLHRNYFNSFTVSNVGELSWDWIPTINKFKKRKKISSWLVYLFLKNVKVGVSFQVMSCSGAAQGNVQKGLLQVQSCCFLLNLWLFWNSLPSLASNLKVPNNIHSYHLSHWKFKTNGVVRH